MVTCLLVSPDRPLCLQSGENPNDVLYFLNNILDPDYGIDPFLSKVEIQIKKKC